MVGVAAHFPGSLMVNVATILLMSAGLLSDGESVGHGDIKFWLTLLWIQPKSLADISSILIFLVLFMTSAVQILISRLPRSDPIAGRVKPAAWRAILFMILILIANWVQVQHA